VRFDRRVAADELASDLTVQEAARDKAEHFELARVGFDERGGLFARWVCRHSPR
jgi:hypothetical protein